MLPESEKSLRWTDRINRDSAGCFRLVNAGKGGRPTDSIDEFKQEWHRANLKSGSVLILSVGTNDSRDISGKCISNAVANLTIMIDHAYAALPNVKIILVGPANLYRDSLRLNNNIADQRIHNLQALNKAYEQLAKEKHAIFVSLYGVVPESTLNFDGVHPNGDGNAPIAREIRTVLQSLVETEKLIK